MQRVFEATTGFSVHKVFEVAFLIARVAMPFGQILCL
jgi:hypothetical protein